MTNRAFLFATFVPSVRVTLLAAALVAAGCSGGSSGTSTLPASGSGSSAGTGSGSAASGASSGSGGGSSGDTEPDGAAASGAGSGAGGSDASTSSGSAPDASSPGDASIPGWKLTWSDEFDGPDGSAVDPAKWTHDVGGTGWGNNELEYYTDGSQNAVVQGGNLVVTATTEGASQHQCSYGTCKYTSARLLTKGLFAQQYGRFEARAQMPTGKGLWPAIWMLGSNIDSASWPACGEIDFMETIGTDISTNHGSLHMPNNYGPSGTYPLPGGASFADGFHTFAVQWDPGTIGFYVDDKLYETRTQASVPGGDTWEFEHPFFLLINVAVGGQWPGSPDATTKFPQTLKVDWVRVYERDGSEP